MTVLLVIIGLILLIAIGGVAWAISAYNGLIKLRNQIEESWRQIDVELNRRYDLIPNLVETVRGFAAHERNTLEQVTQLRNSAAALASQAHGGPSNERSDVEAQLSDAVRNLIVSVEAYPDLKSNVNFLELQRELTETEDRIAAGRRYYNAVVSNYNTKIESVPTNIIANMSKFEKATYFEVDDPMVRQSPSVNFGEISQRPDQTQSGGPGQLPQQQAQQAPIQPPAQAQPQQPAAQPQVQQQPPSQQSSTHQQPPFQQPPTQQPPFQQPPSQGGSPFGG